MPIIPVAKAIYLCDYHVGRGNGKVDLHGLCNAIRSPGGYPYTHDRFCVFAQLTGGFGQIPFFVDIRFAATEELVWTTLTRQLIFPRRDTLVQVAVSIEGCRFPQVGLYLVQLFCDNYWVCDTTLKLR